MVLTSCTNKDISWESKYPSLTNKSISTIELNSFIENKSDNNNDFSNQEKVVYTLVTASCSPCVDELLKWEKLIKSKSLDEYARFEFIAQGDLTYYFTNSLKEKYRPNLNIMIDSDSSFAKNNGILSMLDEHTLVVDKSNEIIFIGSPILKDHIKNEFITLLKNDEIE